METPPRAWGRQFKQKMLNDILGNTPTCVGKTNTKKERKMEIEKHPHVRGEDTWSATKEGGKPETPPRAWGRRKQ